MFGDDIDTRNKVIATGVAVGVVVFLLLLLATDLTFLPTLIWGIVLGFLAASGLALWLGEDGSQARARDVAEPAPTAASKASAAAPETATAEAPKPKAEEVEEKAEAAAPAPDVAPQKAGPEAGGADRSRPDSLDVPRGGQADDLKKIKGIGPKLEKLCNSLGVYHFDQIAAWSDAEVAWMDENLEGFRGRVTRDKWVEQARELAREGSA